jgi:6-phosphogluconolactonase
VTSDPASVRVAVEVARDAAEVANLGAAEIAAAVRDAVRARGSCTIAVSGGSTPWSMFFALASEDVPWRALAIWQVDERIAPQGHDDRGLTHLEASLPAPGLAVVHPMPVGDLDPEDAEAGIEAADRYAAGLPTSFDLIHLGLGEDGHTASLVPGDPVLDVRDRDVAITDVYRGRRRMTLTYPVLDRARRILWIVTGASKADPLRKLVERDPSIPASRVAAPSQLAIVDREAAATS